MSDFFQEIEGMSPWFKSGSYGTEGSGKSFTMALIAIGLHRHIKSTKPVVMWDSEQGSDFLMPVFRAAGIKLLGIKSRSLEELGKAIKKAPEVADILMIDSLTHAYNELLTAYKKTKKGGGFYIDMRDWGKIKDEWRAQFAHPYVQSQIHIMWCARSKNIFEDVLDVEATARAGGQEKYTTISVGTGAKAETESAYEPSLLMEMEKVFSEPRKGRKARGAYNIRMIINKDRANEIMGESFQYEAMTTADAIKACRPFKDVLPHFAFIQREGKSAIPFSDSTSEGLFEGAHEDADSYFKYKRDKDICLEEIGEEIKRHFGGQTTEMKMARSDLMHEFFNTRSWTKIEGMRITDLKEGRERLWIKLNGAPYTLPSDIAGPDKSDEQMDDELKALETPAEVNAEVVDDGDIPAKAPERKINTKESRALYKAAREVYDDDVVFLKQVGVSKLTDCEASLIVHIEKMIERKREENKAAAA